MARSSGGPEANTVRWWVNSEVSGVGAHNDREVDKGFPSQLLTRCLAVLRFLCSHRRSYGVSREANACYWNELERLYLWSEHFEDDRLEVALHPSDELRISVLDLLNGIARALLILTRLASIEVETTGDVTDSSSDLSILIEKADVIVEQYNSQAHHHNQDESDQVDDISETLSNGDEDDALEEIQFNTRCLMQLGPALQQNIVCSKKIDTSRFLSSPETFRVSGPARIYVSLAREKFKKADLHLVERLGESNWQRHVRIRDMMFERNYNSEEQELAYSVFRSPPTFHDSGLGTTILVPSQYADSEASHTSFATNIENEGISSLRVPSISPEIAKGQPFVCFICGTLQSKIRSRIDWKIHVFADIQPYICTFSNCDHELVQFPTRAAWADHEFRNHRFQEQWSCPDCGIQESSSQDWERHIDEEHGLSFSGPDLLIAKKMARRTTARPIDTEECLLCRDTPAQSRRGFVRHVSRHMEEMALLALPRDAEDMSNTFSDDADQIPEATDDVMLRDDAESENTSDEDVSGICQPQSGDLAGILSVIPTWAQFWVCGHCKVAKMSVREFFCSHCGQRRDIYAKLLKTGNF